MDRHLNNAFDAKLLRVWTFCNIGRACRHGTPYQLTLVEPSAEDVQALQQIAQSIFFPEWTQRCERMRPGCREEWEERVLSHLPYRPSLSNS